VSPGFFLGSVVKKGTSVRRRICIVAALFFLYSSTSCSSELVQPGVQFTEAQRQIADQIISVFENNTPVLQYGYAEELGDGRGITAGRAGFTSATGDMYKVVALYSKKVPGNQLQVYLPTLKSLAHSGSSDIRKLTGLSAAWQSVAQDPQFKTAQDQVVDTLYYNRAVSYSGRVGATQALSLLILYDAVIQHGFGADPDGLPALIKRTNTVLIGSAFSEQQWNSEFLKQRRRTLSYSSSSSTRSVWAESVGRVDTLQTLVNEGNVHLKGGFVIDTWGTSFVLEAIQNSEQ
jgi:chitosanase